MLNNDLKRKPAWHFVRIVVSAVVLVMLLLAARDMGWAGFASLLSTYGARGKNIAATQAASSLSPNDPEPHYVQGAILEANGDLPAAVEEYTQAARLRADDYVLWLALAHARELEGDTAGALAAARQGVALAPHYAQPHWQLGNILVRARQLEEGFGELRLAGQSDPQLLPAIIDLAWQLSGEDVELVKRLSKPQSPDFYKALAEYFKKRNRLTDAVEMFRAAGSAAAPERQLFLEEMISAKRFDEAALLWSMDHPADSQNMVSELRNAGFEQEGDLDKPGFSWRQDNKAESLSISLDLSKPKEGRSSLRVDFEGDADPGAPILSQLILVEPRTRYQLHFAARTEGLVSGGLPYVALSDARNNNVLGQSGFFPRQVTDWQDYVIDFNSSENTNTIQLTLRRMPCSKSPCPIFGHLWLDNFSLRKL
jgi:tetratricopeptide (TPR) repeat protein